MQLVGCRVWGFQMLLDWHLPSTCSSIRAVWPPSLVPEAPVASGSYAWTVAMKCPHLLSCLEAGADEQHHPAPG